MDTLRQKINLLTKKLTKDKRKLKSHTQCWITAQLYK